MAALGVSISLDRLLGRLFTLLRQIFLQNFNYKLKRVSQKQSQSRKIRETRKEWKQEQEQNENEAVQDFSNQDKLNGA